MTDRIDALTALLLQAEEAHGVHETTELNGVYDENWPAWYAAYAVDHGIADHVGRPVTVAELAELLTAVWAELQGAGPEPTEPWASFAAGRIATDLSQDGSMPR